MSQFETAILTVLRNEGGWSDNPADAGGQTYKGISLTQDPEFPGWGIIETAKGQPGFPQSLADNATLQQMIVDFYRRKYWQFDGIESQDVATKVFDMVVNFGPTGGMTAVQQAIKRCCSGPIVADGQYGPRTEAAINACNAQTLLRELRLTSVKRYVGIVLNEPAQEVFLEGWLERAVQ